MKQWLTGSITLSKLKSVITEKTGKDGSKVKGIFIPFDANYLTVKEGAVYLNVRVGIHEEPDQYDQDAMITHSVDSKTYKAASDEEKEELKTLPILGNLRDFGNTSSAEDSTTEVAEEEDLPF